MEVALLCRLMDPQVPSARGVARRSPEDRHAFDKRLERVADASRVPKWILTKITRVGLELPRFVYRELPLRRTLPRSRQWHHTSSKISFFQAISHQTSQVLRAIRANEPRQQGPLLRCSKRKGINSRVHLTDPVEEPVKTKKASRAFNSGYNCKISKFDRFCTKCQ